MSKRRDTRKLEEFGRGVKDIENKLKDDIAKAEAKLLLHILIYHFNGFARQQQLINVYMSLKYHWGNKRTARVLKSLSKIGVVNRWKSKSDNWTLFFQVKGFLEECKERIIRASLAIMERLGHYFSPIFLIKHIGKKELEPDNMNTIQSNITPSQHPLSSPRSKTSGRG